MNCYEADLGRRGAQRPAPGRQCRQLRRFSGVEDNSGWQTFLPCPCVQLIISDACRNLLESAAEYLPDARWQATSVTCSRRFHARESREAADSKARAIVDDLRAAKTSTPRGSWRLRDRCVARLRNRSASGQAAAKARRTRLAVSMTRILYRSASSTISRVNAKAPRIRAWPGARESLIFALSASGQEYYLSSKSL
jgi:hypothetical protein